MASERGRKMLLKKDIPQAPQIIQGQIFDVAGELCSLGRDLAGNWETASRREWLVTNGIGGYAAGTVSGANTRRYHGLLIASLAPPVQRVVGLAKADISVDYLGQRYELGANEFGHGTVNPNGYIHIESFCIHRGIPTWRFSFADVLLEQQVFMAPGLNTSYLGIRVLRASATLNVFVTPLCTYRDYHSHSRGSHPYILESSADTCSVKASVDARTLQLSMPQGRFEVAPDWYWNFYHGREAERGLDATEDLFKPGRFYVILEHTQTAYLHASMDLDAKSPPASAVLASLEKAVSEIDKLLPPTSPPWIRQLALASDQFLVKRGQGEQRGSSVIAGYPWFADWGRDTMISLPGITSCLGRHAASADILQTFAKFVNGGMLPNRFPDGGEAPEFNTVDATLWYFQAVNEYIKASKDSALGKDLYPTLIEIIRAHVAGTRFGIHLDAQDALLHAGVPGVQLTWMDAKVGDWVVTPRVGKPVEINALWLNALSVTLDLAKQYRDTSGKQLCADLLERGTAGFGKFWNESGGYLYDVLEVDGGSKPDPSLRPNQIFAVSLPVNLLSATQMRSIVEVCGRELLTSVGLRSLAAGDAAYRGRYQGDPRSRDGAYHQGTVWPWLLGPFSLAHYRVYGNAEAAQALLAPIGLHLRDACLGSVSEVLDGDAPHSAGGCFAQAWSAAEILRCWLALESLRLGNRAMA